MFSRMIGAVTCRQKEQLKQLLGEDYCIGTRFDQPLSLVGYFASLNDHDAVEFLMEEFDAHINDAMMGYGAANYILCHRIAA